MTSNNSKDIVLRPHFYLPSSFPFPTATATATATSTSTSTTSSSTPPPSYIYNYSPNQKPRKKRTKLVMINEPHILQQQQGIPSTYPPKCNRKPPDPLAPKITRPCTECGKKFWSWKALFGHMRCHPERQWRGINPPPTYIREPPPATTTTTTSSPLIQNQKDRYFLGTLGEANNMSEEEHEVAACLLMLANRDDNGNGGCSASQILHHDQEAPCCFGCPSCKKVFGSHQALGGHRASHKNVKGCFAITRSGGDDCQIPGEENLEEEHNMMVVFGHKCDICLRVFSSGLALGGHKRCHWEKAEEASSSMLNHQFSRGPNTLLSEQAGGCELDLNLPASMEHDSASSSTLTLDLRLGL